MSPQAIRHYLDQKQVPFRVAEHPVRGVTAQEVAASAHVSGKRFAKSVVLRLRGQYVLAVLPADERVDLDRLSALCGDAVTLASEQECDQLFPECERGALPPLGELFRLPVVADEHLAHNEWICMSGGTHTDLIEMRWDDFQRLAHPQVVDCGARWQR